MAPKSCSLISPTEYSEVPAGLRETEGVAEEVRGVGEGVRGRNIDTGLSEQVVIFRQTCGSDDVRVRIISARKATRKEQSDYFARRPR